MDFAYLRVVPKRENSDGSVDLDVAVHNPYMSNGIEIINHRVSGDELIDEKGEKFRFDHSGDRWVVWSESIGLMTTDMERMIRCGKYSKDDVKMLQGHARQAKNAKPDDMTCIHKLTGMEVHGTFKDEKKAREKQLEVYKEKIEQIKKTPWMM